MLVLPLLLGMCTKEDKQPFQLHSKVNVENSSVKDDFNVTTLWFSTNDGKSYSANPVLAVGKKFKVRVMDENTGLFLINSNCFAPDWSLSNPKPDNAASDSPDFTLAESLSLHVVVTNLWLPPDPSSWAGDWVGAEGTLLKNGASLGAGSNDDMPFTVDPANTSNGLIMDNFFGDGAGVTVNFVLNPSTNLEDQTVTVPTQTTSEGGVAAGSGTFDQCTKALTISVTYTFGATVYSWTYVFSRA